MLRPLKYLLWLFLPFGIIHLLIVIVRNKLYDWHIPKTVRLPKPVISIGNIQMGGTGKTPLAITLLTNLQNMGVSVGVLTRGYKRKSTSNMVIRRIEGEDSGGLSESTGDEPAVILKRMTSGVLGIGRDRWQVGEKILEGTSVDLFLLDDGLQHRRLHRDLDICLIDVSRWEWHPFLFPFSYLRDGKAALNRCNAVILTKIGNGQEKAGKLRNWINARYQIPVFDGELESQALIRLRDGVEIGLAAIGGGKVAAFCGIANPDHFFGMLKQIGIELILEKKYPDHHNYTLDDLNDLEATIKGKAAGSIITTEKDAVKLGAIPGKRIFEGVELYFLKVEFVIKEENEFSKLVHEFVPPKSFN